MLGFWFSIQKLSEEGTKLTWFGVIITVFGHFFPNHDYIFWLGIIVTLGGLILKLRSEKLKALNEAPRTLTSTQKEVLLEVLVNVPKQPMTVGYFGQDTEAQQYAIQIKNLFESAGFQICRLEGFIVFQPKQGLDLTTHGGDAYTPTSIGIRDAFGQLGIQIDLNSVPGRIEPPISFNVHKKVLQGFTKLVP